MALSPLLAVMTSAAIKAGRGLMRDFGEVDNLQISRKGTANFVTAADLRTEKFLQRELTKARPGFGFLLEEGGEIAGTDPEHRWIIDPLDGTSNFIHAIHYFCISIGLERRAGGKNEIVAGVIFDPLHNELFVAEQHKGAFLNDRRLVVSNRRQSDEIMIATASHRQSALQTGDALASLSRIARSGAIVRTMGATALDLAHIAAGRLDGGWYHTLHPWDIAAGILLIQEAGGCVTDLSGGAASAQSPTLLATNRHIHSNILSLIDNK